MTQTVHGYAARDTGGHLSPFSFERRDLREDDVQIDILYCGVCHSDLHQARNDWGWSNYPLVPGHEIIGPAIIEHPATTLVVHPQDSVFVDEWTLLHYRHA